MRLRNLQLRDASLMLEWMHDKSVVEDLQGNFRNKTIDDCYSFILKSWEDKENLHFAVVDDTDTYVGTVSLKHVDECRKQAEFAIVMRSCAMGKGISQYAMREMLQKGFIEMELEKIYWYVSEKNRRALRFYEKNGYKRVNSSIIDIRGGYKTPQSQSYIWYQAER